jgi:segregation and condensation protein A
MSDPSKSESVRILLNPNLALKHRPWDLNIQKLLEEFLDFLKQKPVTDMRLSGLALITSSLIYKLKVENLFYEEVRYARRRISELTEPVDVLKMPFRLQPPVSDVADLIAALQSLLLEIERAPVQEHEKNPFTTGIQAEVIETDNITVLIEEYSQPILERLSRVKQFAFSELIAGKAWEEAIRVFLTVLFLAHQQKLVIIQDESTEQIVLVGVG